MNLTNPLVVLGGFLVIAAIAVGAKTWYRSNERVTATDERAAPASDQDMRAVGKIDQRWRDTVLLAESTAKMSLPGVVADMQAQRRALADASVGKCTTDALTVLAREMDSTIALYLIFMAEDESIERAGRMKAREEIAARARQEFMTAQTACAP